MEVAQSLRGRNGWLQSGSEIKSKMTNFYILKRAIMNFFLLVHFDSALLLFHCDSRARMITVDWQFVETLFEQITFKYVAHMNEASDFWEWKWHQVPDLYTSTVLDSLDTAFVTGLVIFVLIIGLAADQIKQNGLADSCDSGIICS